MYEHGECVLVWAASVYCCLYDEESREGVCEYGEEGV